MFINQMILQLRTISSQMFSVREKIVELRTLISSYLEGMHGSIAITNDKTPNVSDKSVK